MKEELGEEEREYFMHVNRSDLDGLSFSICLISNIHNFELCMTLHWNVQGNRGRLNGNEIHKWKRESLSSLYYSLFEMARPMDVILFLVLLQGIQLILQIKNYV